MLRFKLNAGMVSPAPRCITIVFAVIAACGAACEDEELLPLLPSVPSLDPPTSPELCAGGALANATIQDLGFPSRAVIPSDFDLAIGATGNDILLGTADGVWRRPLDGSRPWSHSGLENRQIRDIETIRGLPQVVLAVGGGYPEESSPGAFHRSMDEGKTWRTGARLVEPNSPDRSLRMTSIARQPGPEAGGMGLLYVSLTAHNLARSHDGGATWELLRGEWAANGGGCELHVPAWSSDWLYEGCTNGIQSWTSRRDIVRDGSGSGRYLARPDEPNRGSTIFASVMRMPGVVVANETVGMVRFHEAETEWIYKTDHDMTTGMVTAFPQWAIDLPGQLLGTRALWIDPCDPAHMVFGGGPAPGLTFPFMESFDGALSAAPVEGPLMPAAPMTVEDSAAIGPGGKDFLMVALYGQRGDGTYRVLLRSHSPRLQ